MKNPQLLQHGSVARRLHFWSLLILTLLMLSGCVRGEILIDISQDYSGHLTATLGIDRSLLSMARGSGQDPFETLIGDDLPSDVRVERWAEGDYEWMRGERSFNNLAELEYMLTDGVFEEVEVSVQDRKFMLRGRTRAMEGEPDEPMSQMAAGVINFRLFIKAPGETIETNGIFDRDLGAYSWNIKPYVATDIVLINKVPISPLIWLVLGGVVVLCIVVAASIAILLTRRAQKEQTPFTFPSQH
jgi:hypothetical protein